MGLVSVVIAGLALVCSAVAVYYARAADVRSRHDAEISLRDRLQSQYDEIRARMDIRYRDEAWRPDPSDLAVWVPLEEYWFFCYHEWRVTKNSPDERYQKLWDEDIALGVKAGLSHAPLRYVLAKIRSRGSLKDVYARGFVEEIIRIHGTDFQAEFDE